jgi:hypothetical protein
MTETEQKLQYVERTWDDEFPEHIEKVLENDYVRSPDLYTSEMLAYIRANLLIAPEIESDILIELVHKFRKHK